MASRLFAPASSERVDNSVSEVRDQDNADNEPTKRRRSRPQSLRRRTTPATPRRRAASSKATRRRRRKRRKRSEPSLRRHIRRRLNNRPKPSRRSSPSPRWIASSKWSNYSGPHPPRKSRYGPSRITLRMGKRLHPPPQHFSLTTSAPSCAAACWMRSRKSSASMASIAVEEGGALREFQGSRAASDIS